MDLKDTHPAWLKIIIDNVDHFLYEDERGFHLTTDPNMITRYRYHDRDSTLLKNLNIKIPLLAKKTIAFESADSILEIRYLESNQVHAILRYQKHTGYLTRYFHLHNGSVILNEDSNNQLVFEIPKYWHW
jgi:hypothetical protein